MDKATKAATAAKTASDTLKKTNATIVASKKTVTDSNAKVKTTEAAITKFAPTLAKAEATLETQTLASITASKAYESVLIATNKMVSFSDSIAPIFAQRCVACHNARTAKGRLNLDSFAATLKGGESGLSFEAGKADDSTLVALIEDGSMPKDADPLTADQIKLIKKWINTGGGLNAGVGVNDPLIALVPKRPQPMPPKAYRVPVPVTAVAFSPDGKQLASSGYHEVILWNPADGKMIRRITNIAERVYDITYSADGKQMAVAAGTPGQIGEIKLFSTADGSLQGDLVRTGDSVFAVAYSPDGKKIAAAGADRAIRIYDLATGKQLLAIEDHADWVMDVAWTPDGKKLASASRDKTSKVFDATTGDSLVTFNSHGQPVFGVGFSADGNQVITSGRDKNIRVWNTKDAKQVRAIGGFGDEVFRVVVAKDGKVYSSSADKTARVHTVGDGKQVRSLAGHKDWVYSVAVTPDSKLIATGSYDGEIRIWNAADGKGTVTFVAAPGYKAPKTAAK